MDYRLNLSGYSKNAAYAADSDNYFKALVRYSADLSKLMNQHKVNVYQTSDAILAQQLKGWDEVIGDFNKKDPFFKRLADSQKKYARGYEVLAHEPT